MKYPMSISEDVRIKVRDLYVSTGFVRLKIEEDV